jgi:predicted anti-sigma-YlaC factor YlaD
MNEKKVTCKEVMSHICESLGEDLNSEKCVEIKTHLDGCPECQNYFKTVEFTIDCYRNYNIELPQDAHDRLIDFLGLEEKE